MNQQDIDVHEWTSHLKCNKCEEEFDNQKNLDEHMQKHVQLIYQCESCDQQAVSKEEMITHKKNQHVSNGSENTERKYKDLEDKYNLLKENYERLIQLNKKSETSQKDRELALETQNEELRIGYEKVKTENIKLQNNLDTQNKLWKIWIQNFENNKIEVDKEQKSDKKTGNNKEDDEIAIIEEEGIDNDIDDEETELIF